MGFNVNRLDNFSLLDERLSTPQMSILSTMATMMLIVLNFSFLNWPEIVLAVGVF